MTTSYVDALRGAVHTTLSAQLPDPLVQMVLAYTPVDRLYVFGGVGSLSPAATRTYQFVPTPPLAVGGAPSAYGMGGEWRHATALPIATSDAAAVAVVARRWVCCVGNSVLHPNTNTFVFPLTAAHLCSAAADPSDSKSDGAAKAAPKANAAAPQKPSSAAALDPPPPPYVPWQVLPPPPHAYHHVPAVVFPATGKLVLISQWMTAAGSCLDLRTGEWTKLPFGFELLPRYGMACVAIDDVSRVLCVGGRRVFDPTAALAAPSDGAVPARSRTDALLRAELSGRMEPTRGVPIDVYDSATGMYDMPCPVAALPSSAGQLSAAGDGGAFGGPGAGGLFGSDRNALDVIERDDTLSFASAVVWRDSVFLVGGKNETGYSAAVWRHPVPPPPPPPTFSLLAAAAATATATATAAPTASDPLAVAAAMRMALQRRQYQAKARWVRHSTMRMARASFACCVVDDALYALGGEVPSPPRRTLPGAPAQPAVVSTAACERFISELMEWRAIASLPARRRNHFAVVF